MPPFLDNNRPDEMPQKVTIFFIHMYCMHYRLFVVGGYLQRNISRWSKQYEASKTQEIDAMNQLMDWLPKHMPQNERVTVVHGDFRLVYIFISSLWYLDCKFQLSLSLFLEILGWFTYLLDLFSI